MAWLEVQILPYLTEQRFWRDNDPELSVSSTEDRKENHRWFCCLPLWLLFYNLIPCISFLFSGDDGTQTHPENSSQENRIKARCLSCTSMVLKAVWGLLIILSVSSSWVGTTQIVKITYKNFYCPFFMTWFSTNWNIMFFPVYYSGHLATAQEKQSPMKKFRYVLCKWSIGDVLK